jgi:hypothetical protein
MGEGARVLTVGIDEVGYGPRLGPLVVAAAAARGPLRAPVRIADSKRVFTQARGLVDLEPAVLGFLRARSLRGLLDRLGAGLAAAPWYEGDVALPDSVGLDGLDGAWAAFVDAEEFNRRTREQNKSDLLFELATDLINRIRAERPGPIRFVVGKQGGRRYYRRGLAARVDAEVVARSETAERSAYEIPGATIEFLRDAEDAHELVALASMIGKYARERAMGLFNQWWAGRVEGLRPTAGYGLDGARFWREIEPACARLGLAREAVLRLR